MRTRGRRQAAAKGVTTRILRIKNRVWNTTKGIAETVDDDSEEEEEEEECGSEDEECQEIADHLRLKSGVLLDDVLPIGTPIQKVAVEEGEGMRVNGGGGAEVMVDPIVQEQDPAGEREADRSRVGATQSAVGGDEVEAVRAFRRGGVALGVDERVRRDWEVYQRGRGGVSGND